MIKVYNKNMFETIPTPELEKAKEALNGEELGLVRSLVEREIAKRALFESVDQSELLDAIRNDISGIYDAMDDTPTATEHVEQRWLH